MSPPPRLPPSHKAKAWEAWQLLSRDCLASECHPTKDMADRALRLFPILSTKYKIRHNLGHIDMPFLTLYEKTADGRANAVYITYSSENWKINLMVLLCTQKNWTEDIDDVLAINVPDYRSRHSLVYLARQKKGNGSAPVQTSIQVSKQAPSLLQLDENVLSMEKWHSLTEGFFHCNGFPSDTMIANAETLFAFSKNYSVARKDKTLQLSYRAAESDRWELVYRKYKAEGRTQVCDLVTILCAQDEWDQNVDDTLNEIMQKPDGYRLLYDKRIRQRSKNRRDLPQDRAPAQSPSVNSETYSQFLERDSGMSTKEPKVKALDQWATLSSICLNCHSKPTTAMAKKAVEIFSKISTKYKIRRKLGDSDLPCLTLYKKNAVGKWEPVIMKYGSDNWSINLMVLLCTQKDWTKNVDDILETSLPEYKNRYHSVSRERKKNASAPVQASIEESNRISLFLQLDEPASSMEKWHNLTEKFHRCGGIPSEMMIKDATILFSSQNYKIAQKDEALQLSHFNSNTWEIVRRVYQSSGSVQVCDLVTILCAQDEWDNSIDETLDEILQNPDGYKRLYNIRSKQRTRAKQRQGSQQSPSEEQITSQKTSPPRQSKGSDASTSKVQGSKGPGHSVGTSSRGQGRPQSTSPRPEVKRPRTQERHS